MAGSKGILIKITDTKGSTPRDKGAQLWVGETAVEGSIGGGRLEADAIHFARKMLTLGRNRAEQVITLGPEIGQCCGGVVELSFERASRPSRKNENLVIFGAGHVGAEIAHIARAMGFEVALYDNRAEIEIENPVEYHLVSQPETLVSDIPSGSHALILTHDHGLDFRLAERVLLRDDLGFLGMIGSKSKAAQFRSQFSALGNRLERLHSPIAKSSPDKRPKAIALAIMQEVYQFTL